MLCVEVEIGSVSVKCGVGLIGNSFMRQTKGNNCKSVTEVGESSEEWVYRGGRVIRGMGLPRWESHLRNGFTEVGESSEEWVYRGGRVIRGMGFQVIQKCN